MQKVTKFSIFGVLLSLLAFCTSCQYMPEIFQSLSGLKLKESIEIDIPEKVSNEPAQLPNKEFPHHCNEDVSKEKL